MRFKRIEICPQVDEETNVSEKSPLQEMFSDPVPGPSNLPGPRLYSQHEEKIHSVMISEIDAEGGCLVTHVYDEGSKEPSTKPKTIFERFKNYLNQIKDYFNQILHFFLYSSVD